MAEIKQREGFTFYRSFRDSINEIDDPTTKLDLFQAITDFALDGVEPNAETISKMGRICWTALRPYLHSDRNRFVNGCKGGAPSEKMKGNQNARKYPIDNHKTNLKQSKNKPKTNLKQSNVNDNDNDNDNVNENRDSKKSVARFTPPTLEEVKAYIAECGYTVNADAFFNYYESIGWKVGKNTMKDWQASVRKWQSQEQPATPQQSISTTKSVREWTA